MANKEQIEKLKDALKTKKKELGEVEEAWKTARGKLSKVLQRFKSLQEQNRAKKKELKAAKATIAELRAHWGETRRGRRRGLDAPQAADGPPEQSRHNPQNHPV